MCDGLSLWEESLLVRMYPSVSRSWLIQYDAILLELTKYGSR
jgi:hypothetical protein